MRAEGGLGLSGITINFQESLLDDEVRIAFQLPFLLYRRQHNKIVKAFYFNATQKYP